VVGAPAAVLHSLGGALELLVEPLVPLAQISALLDHGTSLDQHRTYVRALGRVLVAIHVHARSLASASLCAATPRRCRCRRCARTPTRRRRASTRSIAACDWTLSSLGRDKPELARRPSPVPCASLCVHLARLLKHGSGDADSRLRARWRSSGMHRPAVPPCIRRHYPASRFGGSPSPSPPAASP